VSDAPIRVVIADDSETVRRLLRRWLSPEYGFEVVGEAENGARCLDLVVRLRPAIVVMDVDMPEMDGLEATRQVMSRAPTPILIFTSSTLARERKVAFEALAAGALDVFHKPRIGPDDDVASAGGSAYAFRRLLALLAPIKVISRHGSRARPAIQTPVRPAGATPRVLAIAASTGGPVALVKVLSALPPTFPVCTLLVQHHSSEFMPGFIEWLGENIRLPVKQAANGDALRPAVVLVAPGDWHMRLGDDGRVQLDRGEPLHACRPAADALFSSVARAMGSRSIGVLLTGMGRDGAQGLLELKHAGALTVAQDEATSIVYGMPKAAADLGAVDEVLPLEAIGDFLIARVMAEARP